MMKLVLATAALSLALAAPVLAKEITGTVASVDKAGDAISLSSGKVFHLPEGIEVETFKVGEKVHLVYATKNGRALVSKAETAM